MNEERYSKQFEIMRNIALSTASGERAIETARTALRMSADLIGLAAGTLLLWDEEYHPILSVTHADSEEEKRHLTELEEDLFSNLRKERKLVSAYVSFGGDYPVCGFTLPVRKGDEILGAIIGIQPGTGSLVTEDVFLEAFASALSAAFLLDRLNEVVNKHGLDAVIATATTVNHEINNSLQAILGIVQLLTKERKDLDEDIIERLKVIEESAVTIMKVTHKLMNITDVKFTKYIDGTKMLELPEDESPV
jgi:signal transduction histidine kinase